MQITPQRGQDDSARITTAHEQLSDPHVLLPTHNAVAAEATANARRQTFLLRAAAVSLFLLICFLAVRNSSRKTEGRYIYPTDDTYITMSMAKNIAQHGVWGVTRYEFTSCSSTPLFLALLAACYRITGVNDWWPLVLAMVFGALSVIAADQFLASLSIRLRALALLAFVLLIPLHIVAATGMEHCLHIWLCLLFLALAIQSIETAERVPALFILAPIMVLVRFESIFLIGICAAFLALRRRWIDAFGLTAAGAAAIGAYAWFSMAHGWPWMPTSVLIKGFDSTGMPRIRIPLELLMRGMYVMFRSPHLDFLVLLMGALILATDRKLPHWDRRQIALFITIFAILVHAAFARTGWVFRYEAYLIALAIVSVFLVLPALRLRIPATIALFLVAAFTVQSLAHRTYVSFVVLPRVSHNIYEQQYQIARFLQRFDPHASVAANDIGWISYTNDIHLLDLAGLATLDVFRDIRHRTYNTAAIDSLATQRGVKVAIVYDAWFGGSKPQEFGSPHLPSQWVRVCRWYVTDDISLGDSTVSFYAVQPSEAPALRSALHSYAPSLPPSDTVLQN